MPCAIRDIPAEAAEDRSFSRNSFAQISWCGYNVGRKLLESVDARAFGIHSQAPPPKQLASLGDPLNRPDPDGPSGTPRAAESSCLRPRVGLESGGEGTLAHPRGESSGGLAIRLQIPRKVLAYLT